MKKKKTKTMIFNFSRKKQFSTRLMLKDKIVETVKDTKLLGTIICDNLKWNKNTRSLVKRAQNRQITNIRDVCRKCGRTILFCVAIKPHNK